VFEPTQRPGQHFVQRAGQRSGRETSGSVHSGFVVLEGTEAGGAEHPPPLTLPALHLFLHAAFTARDPATLDDEARDAAALFGVGAISQAAALARLPDSQLRSLTRALLRWSFGAGRLHAWHWERGLRKRALSRHGRFARNEGGVSLLGWLQGEDPAQRFSRLLDRVAATAEGPREHGPRWAPAPPVAPRTH
jgi:hypothetical protein